MPDQRDEDAGEWPPHLVIACLVAMTVLPVGAAATFHVMESFRLACLGPITGTDGPLYFCENTYYFVPVALGGVIPSVLVFVGWSLFVRVKTGRWRSGPAPPDAAEPAPPKVPVSTPLAFTRAALATAAIHLAVLSFLVADRSVGASIIVLEAIAYYLAAFLVSATALYRLGLLSRPVEIGVNALVVGIPVMLMLLKWVSPEEYLQSTGGLLVVGAICGMYGSAAYSAASKIRSWKVGALVFILSGAAFLVAVCAPTP